MSENDGPLWEKLEDFIYEIKDPSGGVYRIVAKGEKDQEQLFSLWTYTYVLCEKPRPQDGETHLLKV
jgi:hypothetical protein